MSLIRELPRQVWANLRWIAVIAAASAGAWSTNEVVHAWRASFTSAHRDNRTIDVAGVARQHVAPADLTWSGSITVHAADRIGALRDLAARTERVRTFLTDHGVRVDELEPDLPQIEESTETVTHHRSDGNDEQIEKPNGFNGTQQLVIRSHDVARILRSVRELTIATETATLVEASPPACTFGDIEHLRAPLIKQARADLRAKADQMVIQLGHAKLGGLVRSDQGSFNADSAGAYVACEDGGDVVATVSATYQLE